MSNEIDIFDLIRNNNIEEVQKYIDEDGDINTQNINKKTVMRYLELLEKSCVPACMEVLPFWISYYYIWIPKWPGSNRMGKMKM